MPDFTVFINMRDIIALSILGAIVLVCLVLYIVKKLCDLIIWYKNGHCFHQWDLVSTASYGTVHKYKCTKCETMRMLDSNYVRRTRRNYPKD